MANNLSESVCAICGRGSNAIGEHPLPRLQEAHLVANRFTGAKRRYGGAKNSFSEEEWNILRKELGSQLGASEQMSLGVAKAHIAAQTYILCGECHEEVLSEPIYTHRTVSLLRDLLGTKSRIDKMVLLARALQIGVEQLVGAKKEP